MKFSDILALAKQGYKPSDIKDILALSEEPEDKKDPEPEDKKDPEPEDKKDPEPEDKIDYKDLYEKTKKELEIAQAQNRKDPGKQKKDKTPEDIALEHFNKILR